MSHQNEKQETVTSSFFLSAGAIVVAMFGMLTVSVGIIALTGIFFGSTQSLQSKQELKKKNSTMVIVSYSRTVEDEIRKGHLDTPGIPTQVKYPVQTSLLNFNYRY